MCIDCICLWGLPDPTRDYRFIAHPIELTDIGTGVAIVAEFEWDEADPWAVTIDFGEHDECDECRDGAVDGRCWTIGRELLKAGLHDDAGVGDAQFRGDVLHPDRRLMILDSPDGRIVLRFDPIEVSSFVESVDRHVRLAATSEGESR